MKNKIIQQILTEIQSLSQITIKQKDGEIKSVVDFYELKGLLEKIAGKTPMDEKSNHLFERFWVDYPRKINKKNAQKIWDKLKVTPELYQKIIVALDQQKKTDQWKNPQYIPHPATWLNGERWNDEVDVKILADNKYKGL